MQRLLSIPLIFLMLSCDDGSCEEFDCAGICGGSTVCGCTDYTATNYDSTATFSDSSCHYLPPCSLNDIYINEAHGDGNPDWVEIYNAGVECSLIGFTLDDQETPEDFIFGDVILVAYGYWLGREDDENSFNFGIEKNGETLWFCYGTSNCQAFEVGNTENLTAWGYPNNDRSQSAGNLTQSTPGSANTD